MSTNPSTTLTLLLSQKDLPKNWRQDIFQRIPNIEQVDLFLLDQATHLLNESFSQLPAGKRLFCAHSHHLLKAQPATENSMFAAGGLANLGEMLRDSHWGISLPNSHWPIKKSEPGVKNVGIFLGNHQKRQKEAIRLAAGLAGCNHMVTLYTPINYRKLLKKFPETAPLLEALQAMHATFKPLLTTADPPVSHPVLLQL